MIRRIVTVLFAVAFSMGAHAQMEFVEDFETGMLKFVSGKMSVSGNAPYATSEVARAGKYSMKSVLHRWASPVKYRTEVSLPLSPRTRMGDDIWYGFSIYLPHSYVPGKSWELVAQWHDKPDNWKMGRQNPPLALNVSRGRWGAYNLWDADPVTKAGKWELDGSKHWDFGPYKTGVWTDWVFHVKWSYGKDGILEIWKDGKRVVSKKGPNTYNDKMGPYFKVGLYKGWKDDKLKDNHDSRVLYHDEIRVARGRGASYEMVAPGKASVRAPVRPKPPQFVNK